VQRVKQVGGIAADECRFGIIGHQFLLSDWGRKFFPDGQYRCPGLVIQVILNNRSLPPLLLRTHAQSGRRLRELLGVENGDGAVLCTKAQTDGIAADFAIFHIGLIRGRQVE